MSKKVYKTIRKCRVCAKKRLREVIKIKPQYISSTLVKSNKNRFLSKVKIPMTVALCGNCHLVQLKETVKPDLLFQNYFYRSSVNKIMRDNLKDVVKDVKTKLKLSKGDFVVDIGSNDCLMLDYFPNKLRRIGVEPAKNIDWSGVSKSIKIVNDYFSKEKVFKATKGKKAKVVTATAVFYDLDDPNQVTADIKDILADDGVVCIQVSYLHTTVKDTNFYDFCHEHLMYFSLETLNYLLEKNGLRVFDALINQANGGSVRVFVTHKENKRRRTKGYKRILNDEKQAGLAKVGTYRQFSMRMNEVALWLKEYLADEVAKGKLVIGLGASTKGNVVLQFCKINNKILPFISDRNKDKVGYRTLGTDIEVISEKHARKLKPSMMLVGPWYFKKEIIEREKRYLKKGGRLLFTMPYPHIVDRWGEKKIRVKESAKRTSKSAEKMMNLENKRILVTGGAGFVGSHLIDRLVQSRGVKRSNIVVPRSSDNDLKIYKNAKRVVKGVDVVFNLACDVGGSGYSVKHPARQLYNALMIALQVIEAAKDEGVEKIVMVSSSCAYPHDARMPLKENELYGKLPLPTMDGYGMAKRMSAFLTDIYEREYDLNAVVVVPNNAYGPRDNFDLETGHVIPSLIRRCLTEKKLLVWGDGTPTRDFIYVKDLAEGLILAAEKLTTTEPINLGSGTETSIKKLVKVIAEETGFKGQVKYDTSKPKGQKRRSVDISKASEFLGFKPEWDLRRGIGETVSWYKEQLKKK